MRFAEGVREKWPPGGDGVLIGAEETAVAAEEAEGTRSLPGGENVVELSDPSERSCKVPTDVEDWSRAFNAADMS